MFSNKFFNISRFAEISGVSRQTLIYYDKIGLFSPHFVAENKYRMYSHNQLGTINTITMLRDLGVPLKTIKKVVSDISPQTTVKILNYQLDTIAEKIHEYATLQEMIELRISQIETGEKAKQLPQQFFVKEIEEEIHFYVGDKLDCNQQDVTDDIMVEFIQKAEKTKIPLIFSIGYVKNWQDVESGQSNRITNICFKLEKNSAANVVLPKGKYLIGYGKGDYDSTSNIYEKAVEFVKANNLHPVGAVYEQYLIDELAEKNAENFVFEIMVKLA